MQHKTILAAVDGTQYGYLAPQESFAMSNPGDAVIGYHIPLDSYQFAYQHSMFHSCIVAHRNIMPILEIDVTWIFVIIL